MLGMKSNEPEIFFLSSVLQLAFSTYAKYQEMAIPDNVFFSTFSDIRIWADWYRRHTGKRGLDRIHWFRGHISLRLFRLGELQFEVPSLPLPAIWSGVKLDKPVYHVHIPEGADLDGTESSFSYALRFFHSESAYFLTHSWLLSPEISSMLGPEARIRRFSSLFTLLGKEDDRQAEERIFGFVSDDVSSYPISTSLSEKAKEFLEKGGRISSGYGYCLRSISR